jgi:tetratricopeptide (TPR) repeat protein
MIFLIIATFNEAVQLYNAGNKYYAEGNYQSAIEVYEQALAMCPDKDIYYNLGNTYFKTGRIGKAIVQHRRAYFLCPRDEDILFNLNFMRSFRPDRITTISNPVYQILDRCFHYFSQKEITIISAILFLLGAIFLSLFLVMRNTIFIWASSLIFLVFVYSLITASLWQSEINSNPGVVIVSELKAYSGPGEEYKEILVIHDGAEAKIREERNGYYLIQLPGGIGGWVKTEGIEKVYK